MTLENGCYLDDPIHPTNPHFCQAQDVNTVIARDLDRKARQQIRTQGTRPLRAYQGLRATVSETYAAYPNQRQDVMVL